MNKKLLLCTTLLSALFTAQEIVKEPKIDSTAAKTKRSGKVGINTTIPTRALTIKDATATEENKKPALRIVNIPHYSENINGAMDPDLGGVPAGIENKYENYKPLVIDKNGDVYTGALAGYTNIVTLKLSNLDGDWVNNFDTGFPVKDYEVILLSYSLIIPTGTTLQTQYKTNMASGSDQYQARMGVPSVEVSNTPRKAQWGEIEPNKAKLDNWHIYADYPEVDLVTANKSGGTGTKVTNNPNVYWKFTLLVVPKNKINFTELEFNMRGQGYSRKGLDDPNYKTKFKAYKTQLEATGK